MRLLVWAVMLYVTADFSDAGMPGAFNFDADESVEVAYLHKVPVSDPPGPAVSPTLAAPYAPAHAWPSRDVSRVKVHLIPRVADTLPTARRDLHRLENPPTSEAG